MFYISKQHKTIIAISLLSLGVCACDMGTKTEQANKFTKPPFETAKNITIEKEQKLAVSQENKEESFLEKVNVFKSTNKMAEPKGLVTKTLFSENIDKPDDRFARLENAVQLLANKMQTMEPSLTKLTQIDQDLNNITKQLDILVSENNAARNQVPAYRDARLENPTATKSVIRSVVKPTIKPTDKPGSYIVTAEPEALSPAAAPSLANKITNDIQKIRVADHPDKTRLVFEADEKMDMAVAIEPNGRSIIISTNNKGTHINPSSFSGSSLLIKQAHIQDDSLLLKLSSPSDKIAQGYLPPTKANPHHRFYIDIKKIDSI